MNYWFEILKKSNSLGIILSLTFFITVMGLLSPIFIIHIFNRYIAFGLQGTLIFLLTGALAVSVFEYGFRNLRDKILNNIITVPIKNLKLELIQKFFEKEIKIKKTPLFELLDFNNNFFQFLSPKIQSNLLDSLFAVLIIIILFFLNFILGITFLFIITIFLLTQQNLIRKKDYYLKNFKISNSDKLIIKELGINEDLLKTSFAFQYTGFFVDEYFNKKMKIDSFLAMNTAQQFSTTSFFVLISSIVIIGLGSIFVVSGNLSIGSLIGFNIFSTRALGTISSVQNSYSTIEKTKLYLKECSEYFKNSENRAKGMQLSKVFGILKIININHLFQDNKEYLIKNFSATFKPSEVSVISGKNGAGKTVVAKILAGILKPDSGDIILDDTNLKKLSLIWYRKMIAYIPQNVSVLNSSIMNNILLSNLELTEPEVSRLLQNVGLDEELKTSNLTLLDPLNNNISKGILKKIHIARGIARNFKIYIFDDPTLYLDNKGREMVIKLIASLKRSEKTIICFSEDHDIIKLSDNYIKLG